MNPGKFTIQSHSGAGGLIEDLKSLVGDGRPFKGIVFRAVDPEYAGERDICSGNGSYENGGRWNAPGSVHAVYTSLTASTALKELEFGVSYYGLAGHTAYPKIFVALDVSLHNILDLTRKAIRKRMRVSRNQVIELCDWRREQESEKEAFSQAVGRAIYEAGFEGFLAPSNADSKGACLIYFPENLDKAHSIIYLNADKAGFSITEGEKK